MRAARTGSYRYRIPANSFAFSRTFVSMTDRSKGPCWRLDKALTPGFICLITTSDYLGPRRRAEFMKTIDLASMTFLFSGIPEAETHGPALGSSAFRIRSYWFDPQSVAHVATLCHVNVNQSGKPSGNIM